MEQIRAQVLVSGKVQGVNYRFWTLKKARQLGINGWVRNLPDGRVEAVFEGDRAAVHQMVNWCHTGPAAASVKKVGVEESELEGIEGFEILY